jgi:hypothetical protein
MAEKVQRKIKAAKHRICEEASPVQAAEARQALGDLPPSSGHLSEEAGKA